MEYNLISEYLTQERGFSWGKWCNNWVLYTMWEPNVLQRIKFLKSMCHGIDTSSATANDFWNIIESGFKTFEMKLDSLVEPSSNYVVTRIDLEEGYSQPLNSLSTHAIIASEFTLCNGYMTQRCTPLTLVCGGSLADVLKGTLRHNDILIAMGTVKRLDTPNCERITLLNFDDLDGDVVLIRFSFLPPCDGDVRLLESISPADYPDSFHFKYRLRHGRELTTLGRFGNYQWDPSPLKSSWNKMAQLIDGIPIPLQFDADVGDVFHRVVESVVMKRSSSRLPQCSDTAHQPISAPVPPSRLPSRNVLFQELNDVQLFERDSPVFSAKLDSTHSTSEVSRNPRRFSTSDMYIPTASDFWTMTCFVLIVLLGCTLVYWVVDAWIGPEVGNNSSRPNFRNSRITMQNNNENALTRVNRELSRTCWDDVSIFSIILNRIMRVFLWIHENSGFRFIMGKLFGNNTSTI